MAVALWSVEMSAERIARRMLAWLTGISTRDQRTGALSSFDAEALVTAREELRHYRLTIDATAPIGVSTLRRRARQAQRRGALDLVLIDYLQLLRPGDGHDDVPLRDAVPRVSGQLRDLAKELDVPIVALSQLGRDVEHRENKRPMLSDLRWGGELDQDAAVVAMLYREEYYLSQAEPQGGGDPIKADKLHAEWSHALANSRGRAEIGVCKNRDDPVGIARVGFDPVRSHFFDDNQNQGRLW
jgi:replicative DNA helicase